MDFIIISYTNDGTMTVSIEGQKYTYILDAIYIPEVISKAKYNKGQALAYLKKISRDYKKEEVSK